MEGVLPRARSHRSALDDRRAAIFEDIIKLEESIPLVVLVIDDDPLLRWALSESLSAAGHVVVESPDGAEGLRAVCSASRPFDVIFLDFQLSHSNHSALLTALQTSTPGSA